MVVAECGGGSEVGNAEVEWKSPSLSSRKNLGDTTYNSNNLKCKRGNKMGYVGEVGGGIAEVMVEGLGKDVKVPKIWWSQMVLEPI